MLQAVRTRFSYGGLLFLREQQLQPITKPSGKARKGDWSSPKAWAAVEPSKPGQCEEHCQIIVEMTQATSHYAQQLVAALRVLRFSCAACNNYDVRRTTCNTHHRTGVLRFAVGGLELGGGCNTAACRQIDRITPLPS